MKRTTGSEAATICPGSLPPACELTKGKNEQRLIEYALFDSQVSRSLASARSMEFQLRCKEASEITKRNFGIFQQSYVPALGRHLPKKRANRKSRLTRVQGHRPHAAPEGRTGSKQIDR